VQVEDSEANETAADKPRSARHWGVLCLGIVVFALALLASPHVYAWASRGLSGPPPSTERAFFTRPIAASQGVKSGAVIGVTVVASPPRRVAWRASSAGRSVATGTVRVRQGSAAHFEVASEGLPGRSWLTIRVGGISTPLRVWIW
jgi:hypothetical protein